MKILSAVAALVLLVAVDAMAETTNALSDAEIQGRQLAQQLCEIRPPENSTNIGVLQIRDGNGKKTDTPIKLWTITGRTNWQSALHYDWLRPRSDGNTNFDYATLIIAHKSAEKNRYSLEGTSGYVTRTGGAHHVVDWSNEPDLTMPIVDSDFWIADLGLEFFHWPTQKVLKKEIHRTCACTVLESANPNPTTNGYSRVVSWVDTESLGIVEAYAYDFNGKKLKDFYPKDIKKVNGQWQVQTLVMENVQTGSRSRLEFDLKQ